MTLTPKDQAIITELDKLDTASKNIRDIVNAGTPVPPVGPVANFTFKPAGDPNYPRKLLFSGSPVGMVSYAWDWGDGRTETHGFTDTAKTYSVDGTYQVKLEVTDSAGLKNSITKPVVVDFSIPIPPDPNPIPPDPVPVPPGILPYPVAPAGETYAKPPQIFIDTKLPTTTGKTIPVSLGGNLQAALDNAQPGDEITLANGGTYQGNFAVRKKGGTGGWIMIRPADMSKMPPQGTRMTPAMAQAAGLPKLISSNNLGVLTTDPGAQQYRLIGVEGAQPASIPNTGFIRLGVSEKTIADLPKQFVLDRVYLHGSPTGNFRRAVLFNGVDQSIVDSWISECHEHGADSQAVAGWNGPGPFKIDNTYLEAASENVIFGGTDPSIVNLIPSDVVIRRCHIAKQMSWLGQGWVVKNLWEMKNVRRLLLDSCILENVFADGQVGYSTNLKSVNQNMTAPWCHIEDVMMRYCIVRNVGAGFNLIGVDPGATIPSERLTMMHCLVDGFNQIGDQRGVQVLNNPIDVELIHMTILSPSNSSLTFGGPIQTPPVRFVYRDCIAGNGQYGVKGPGLNTKDTFAAFMKDGKYVGNVLIGPDGGSSYPPGNFFAPTEADVGFVSKTDRRLASTSKYKGKATDGTDPGADMDTLNKMVAGVVVAP